jgi:hypothetical protein
MIFSELEMSNKVNCKFDLSGAGWKPMPLKNTK